MRHPASYRQKFAQSKGEAFNYLRRREVSRWATKRQLKRLKELKVRFKRKGLTWVRAKCLIKEAIQKQARLNRKEIKELLGTTPTRKNSQDTTEYNSFSEALLSNKS